MLIDPKLAMYNSVITTVGSPKTEKMGHNQYDCMFLVPWLWYGVDLLSYLRNNLSRILSGFSSAGELAVADLFLK